MFSFPALNGIVYYNSKSQWKEHEKHVYSSHTLLYYLGGEKNHRNTVYLIITKHLPFAVSEIDRLGKT